MPTLTHPMALRNPIRPLRIRQRHRRHSRPASLSRPKNLQILLLDPVALLEENVARLEIIAHRLQGPEVVVRLVDQLITDGEILPENVVPLEGVHAAVLLVDAGSGEGGHGRYEEVVAAGG